MAVIDLGRSLLAGAHAGGMAVDRYYKGQDRAREQMERDNDYIGHALLQAQFDGEGNPLSDEQWMATPQFKQAMEAGFFDNAVPREGVITRPSAFMRGQDGSVVGIQKHIDPKTGEVVAEGPVTDPNISDAEGSKAANAAVVRGSASDWANAARSFAAAKSPSFASGMERLQTLNRRRSQAAGMKGEGAAEDSATGQPQTGRPTLGGGAAQTFAADNTMPAFQATPLPSDLPQDGSSNADEMRGQVLAYQDLQRRFNEQGDGLQGQAIKRQLQAEMDKFPPEIRERAATDTRPPNAAEMAALRPNSLGAAARAAFSGTEDPQRQARGDFRGVVTQQASAVGVPGHIAQRLVPAAQDSSFTLPPGVAAEVQRVHGNKVDLSTPEGQVRGAMLYLENQYKRTGDWDAAAANYEKAAGAPPAQAQASYTVQPDRPALTDANAIIQPPAAQPPAAQPPAAQPPAAQQAPRQYSLGGHDQAIDTTAQKYGIPPEVARGLVHTESRGRADARSGVGAIGLTQVMPATGKEMGFSEADLRDPAKNLDAGFQYLRKMYDKFGSWDLALAAYNGGPGRLQRVGLDISKMPPETRAYVPKVLGGQSAPAPAPAQPPAAQPPAPQAGLAPSERNQVLAQVPTEGMTNKGKSMLPNSVGPITAATVNGQEPDPELLARGRRDLDTAKPGKKLSKPALDAFTSMYVHGEIDAATYDRVLRNGGRLSKRDVTLMSTSEGVLEYDNETGAHRFLNSGMKRGPSLDDQKKLAEINAKQEKEWRDSLKFANGGEVPDPDAQYRMIAAGDYLGMPAGNKSANILVKADKITRRLVDEDAVSWWPGSWANEGRQFATATVGVLAQRLGMANASGDEIRERLVTPALNAVQTLGWDDSAHSFATAAQLMEAGRRGGLTDEQTLTFLQSTAQKDRPLAEVMQALTEHGKKQQPSS